jgi:predicted hydrocarbon binding protein
MDADTVLKMLSRRQRGRFLEGWHHRRETLGSRIHVYTFQERVVGALALSPSMGPVLYEVGKKFGVEFAQDAQRWLSSQPGYRPLSNAKNTEEVNLSGEMKAFQTVYKANGIGLIKVVEYQKDRSIIVEVRECADCFDIENIGKAVCYSVAGNMAGTLEIALNKQLGFVESKCIAKGDSWCEFKFNVLNFDEWEK